MGNLDVSLLPQPKDAVFPRPFGPYLLLSSLGRGGMGEVYLAKSGAIAGIEKACVVKTLRPHLTDDREYTTRFIDEARVVVQLNHRNICQVFDVGVVNERYYLAMEHIAGCDLRTADHRLRHENAPLSPGLACMIVAEVLEALDYAHRHTDSHSGRPMELVHRDVSPQNIMVSFEGEVKLIDFGLAASSLKVEQTQPNVVLGKLAYMAPEQIRGDRLDGRADLFACGVILCELLTGERFYEGLTTHEIYAKAADGGHRPPRFATLDDDVRAVLDMALHQDLNLRYPNAHAFREAVVSLAFARGWRGDGPVLRRALGDAFKDEIKNHKALLARFRETKLPESGPIEPSVTVARAHLDGPTEPTASAPAAKAQLDESRNAIEASNKAKLQQTLEQSVSLDASFAARPRRLAAAALTIAAAAVVGVVLALVVDRGDAPAVTDPAPALAVDVKPAAPPPPVEAPPVETPQPVAAPAPVETAQPAAAPEPEAPKPAEAQKPRGKKSPRATPPAVAAKPPVVVDKPAVADKPVAKPAATKDTAQKPSADSARSAARAAAGTVLGKQVSYLKQYCPQLACTRPVSLDLARMGELSFEQTKKLRVDVDTCFAQCR